MQSDGPSREEERPFRAGRGRRGALLAALAALLVAGASLLLGWGRLRLEWRIHRIENARTWDEARPLLEGLAAEAHRPDLARTAVRRLGAQNPRYTFWYFSYLTWEHPGNNHGIHFHLATFLPQVREFVGRLTGERDLLASWSHFLLWANAYDLRGQLQKLSAVMKNLVEESLRFRYAAEVELSALAEKNPEAIEVTYLVAHAVRLSMLHLTGAPAPDPALPRAGKPLAKLKDADAERVRDWVQAHQPLHLPDAPAVPLPGWKGDVPGWPWLRSATWIY